MQGNGTSGATTISVHQLQWEAVRMINTTLTCAGAAVVAPPVTLVAETSQQLSVGIRLLGQLLPSTIILAQDMRVPADGSWPVDLVVNMSLVLTGLPPPAPRTVLDLYQV